MSESVRIVKESGFNRPATEDEFGDKGDKELAEELDSMLEAEFDEAAVPTYQMISTFDRKKLKMKKHQRAKRKKKMLVKLKWSGKL